MVGGSGEPAHGEAIMSEVHPDQPHPPLGWLFVLPWDFQLVGGVNTVVANLAGECARSGRALPLLLMGLWEYPELTEGTARGLTAASYRLRSPAGNELDLRTVVAFVLTLPSALVVVARFLRRHHVAVVNVHYPGSATLVFVLLRRLRLFRGRLLLSIHGSDVFQAAQTTGIVRWLWRLMLRQSDAVIACSAHLAQECATAFPGAADRLHVIRNGVDVRGIEAAARHELPDELKGFPYLLSVGNFQDSKGHDVLLRAFLRLAPSNPGLHLVCVGQTGPTLPALKAMSLGHGLDTRIHFREDVTPDRVGAYYAGATLFVQPSRREALGIAILEAGVLRKPVVACRVGGIPEILRHRENGILVEPEDDRALADAIAMLLEDRDLARRLGEALYHDVSQRFTWSQAWREYLAIAGIQSGNEGSGQVP